jgi:hypothetical protein
VYSAQDVNDITGTVNANVNPYSAGKNKIINGDFYVNQRAFTSTTTNNAYGFDRFRLSATGGTVTYSAQTFTLGTAPVAGYEGKNFARIDSTGQSAAGDRSRLDQYIESVRTLAGQTATISFWAKAASGTPKVSVEFTQVFGTGGSPSAAQTINGGQVTLSTSWTRFSTTVSVLSISGRTIGTNNDDALILSLWTSAGTTWNSRTGSLGIQTATIDFWGVQVEQGSTATAFQTASGSVAGEFALCQRYYYRLTIPGVSNVFSLGANITTTTYRGAIYFPVEMRIAPSALETTGTANQYAVAPFNAAAITCSVAPIFANSSTRLAIVTATVASGLVDGRPGLLLTDATNGANAYLGWSAEL